MIAPDPMVRCRPMTSPVSPRARSSTGPYPVTSTCTTLGDTRPVSASTEALKSLSNVGDVGWLATFCAVAVDASNRDAAERLTSVRARLNDMKDLAGGKAPVRHATQTWLRPAVFAR